MKRFYEWLILHVSKNLKYEELIYYKSLQISTRATGNIPISTNLHKPPYITDMQNLILIFKETPTA